MRIAGFLLPALAVMLVMVGARVARAAVGADHPEQMAQGLALFKSDVRAILSDNCLRCHGGEQVKADFNLATREGLLTASIHGQAVVPGDASASRLLKLIRREEKPHMPAEGEKLSDAQIAAIETWIKLGAPYDAPLVEAPDAPRKGITQADRRFWSFQPLTRSEPPATDATWPKNDIDRFIMAKLTERGLTPNERADRRTLIRRASLDLTGLPPTSEEVEAFESDDAPDAWPRLIDRLLASAHFGERWARHWLDVARFGESYGFEHDTDRPFAYHYRDFVIEAFNRDMPYDQFVKWQIAGDEYAPQDKLALKATGFLGAGVFPTQITQREVEKARYDALDDMAHTVGTAMLGLTVGCARCHDHKYDPIPEEDYYRFVATFTTTVRSHYEYITNPQEYEQAKAAFDAAHQPLAEKLASFEREELPARLQTWLAERMKDRAHIEACAAEGASGDIPAEVARLMLKDEASRTEEDREALLKWYRPTDEKWQELSSEVNEHLKAAPRPDIETIQISSEGVKPVRLATQGADFFEETYFLKRGDPDQKDGVAAPGFLRVLMPEGSDESLWRVDPPEAWHTSYRRRALAQWITDVDRGAGALLARVIVNRLWQHHLGRGIVTTPSDFGFQGARPTHPELLDDLANELIASGWSLKHIHRLIMTSATYTQSAAHNAASAAADPDNTLHWRFAPRRLEAEVIRDAMLAVSGRLDRTLFGPGLTDPDHTRRGIYFFQKRSRMPAMMVLFDAPDTLGGQGERATTTIAPQALYLMNSPQVRNTAQAFAAKLHPLAERSTEEAIHRAFQMAVSRPPTRGELDAARLFIDTQAASYALVDDTTEGDPLHRALTDFCQTLFGLNEFVYIE